MASIQLPKCVSQEEQNVWKRVIAKRTRQCQRLDEKDVEQLLDKPVRVELEDMPSNIKGAMEKFKWALTSLLCKSVDDKLIPNKRRGSYVVLKILLRKLDKAVQKLPPPLLPLAEIPHSNTEIASFRSITAPANAIQNTVLNMAKPTPENRRGNPALEEPRQNGGTFVNPTRNNSKDALMMDVLDTTISSTSNNQNQRQNQSQNNDPIQRPAANRSASTQRNTSNGGAPQATASSWNNKSSTSSPNKPAAAAVNGPGEEPLQRNSSAEAPKWAKESNNSWGSPSSKKANWSSSSPNNSPWAEKSTTSAFQAAAPPSISVARAQSTTSSSKPSDSAVRQTSTATAKPPASISAAAPKPAAPRTTASKPVAPLPVPSSSVALFAARMGTTASALLVSSDTKPSPIKTDTIQAAPPPPPKIVAQQRPPPIIVLPRIPLPMQPRELKVYSQWVSPASSRYTGALEARPSRRVTWRGSKLSDEEIMSTMMRLYKWDPYWEMLDVRALTKTSAIDKVEAMDGKSARPKRAAEVSFPIPLTYQKQVVGWNKPHEPSYADGEVRLVLRMLPGKIPSKPKNSAAKKKKLRSDYHLWPKGTHCQVDNDAIEISQRKQQAHDHAEWKSLSRLLDVTQHVKTPETITIRTITEDDEPYYLSAAICKFRAPDKLYHTLMNENSIEKLTIQESIQLALEYSAQNTVCLVDDDVDHDNSAPSSFLFKLTCSISSTLMKTPVRARQCKHFQCFDLLNFLQSNVFVSGTRWECPVCNDEVISVYDLQHCALTQKMLRQYKMDATTFRDRVEFFSDGQWQLMPEKRKRNSAVGANGDKKGKMGEPQMQEVIDMSLL